MFIFSQYDFFSKIVIPKTLYIFEINNEDYFKTK